ncbi:MAG TPA: phenylalanine--tRNA ligase subunit beta [Stellaceae bacterium]|jgi:phenylalanyl-tRNA synthetase beta chain|nr:phenylalanine--tRNA ligase subunit beta [Stellaceae bacterium]
MKTTLSWLKTHLDTNVPAAELVERMIMLGHDVEGIEDRAAVLRDFVVAHVVSAEPHPNADRLRVCVVDAGNGHTQVVCGAPNARTGMKGVFGRAGVTVPKTRTVLTESTIRGIASKGMLMSAYELALSDDHDGIIELPEDTPIGTRYAELLGLDDPVIELKVTPNRADCLGVRGIARDLAAAGLGTMIPLDTTPVEGRFRSPIAIHIEDARACPQFLGRHIRGLRNGPSPRWLRDRLEAIGLRPISALVDITNFLTFDLNRPLHVFDAGKIAGDLTVRFARAGEKLLALNGREYALDPEITAISDDNGVQSLGGVIGGEPTGCTEYTTEVFVEAALFDPIRTAATGRRLEIISDARYRFERGIDPDFVAPGLEIATRLILELCGGEPSEIVVAGATPDWHREYLLRPERMSGLGGLHVPPDDSRAILETLGCVVRDAAQHDGSLSVVPPSWRSDIVGEADLVEEVLRVKGFDHIPAVPLPRDTVISRPAIDPRRRRAELVRRTLTSRGLVEAVTFSFLGTKAAELFGGGKPQLRLVNPISADLVAMRPSVLPNLVEAARRNADRGFPDVALFELGPLYRDDRPEGQANVAAGLRTGHLVPRDWRDAARAADLYDAKADALAALAAAGAPIDNVQTSADPPPWFHPGRAGRLRLGPTELGNFGELHPDVLAAYDIKTPVAAFEVFVDAVSLPRSGRARQPLKLSVFQPVERDFAFIVERGLPAETLLRAARGADRKLVTGIRLFDVYEGKGLPDGKKSLAISVVLQPQDATLTEPEIEGFSKRLVAAVEKATGGTLRG